MLGFARPAALVAALLLATSAPAAREPQPQPPKPVDTVLRVDIVVVDAAAIDKRTGRPVGGLRKEDFEVYENGERREIQLFAQEEASLSVVFLFDVTLEAQVYQEQMREAALRALARLRPDDEAAVLAYGVDAEVLRGFTNDWKAVADTIANIGGLASVDTVKLPGGEASFGPGTVLNKGVLLAAQYMVRSASPGKRRAIVVVSPENKPVQVPFKNASKKEVLRELAESNAVVCGLVLDGSFLESANAVGALKFLTVRTGVSTYAEETGGVVAKANGSTLAASLAGVLDDLRARYSLAYVFVPPKKDREYRKIKVKLTPAAERRVGKVAVLARKGYWALAAKP